MDEEIKKSMLKTGTSILGLVCTDGVVLAADRQVSAGNIVIQKDFMKIIPINDKLLTAITGSVSDAQFLMRVVAAELKLKELKNKRKPTVKESASLLSMLTFRSIRQPAMIPSIVGTIVAGLEEDGTAKLYSVEPAGGIVEVSDYDANFGSGMPYILGVLERGYKKDMNVKQGVQLALDCLKASTQRDMGSGYGVDIFTLTKDGVKKVISQEIQSVFK
ncbi:MAG TPA: proteasome subunit beta [Candidatus Paceibacterota bacterium]|nr:proteasome subunit beta [Candidatus Paceibacterota bacterium]